MAVRTVPPTGSYDGTGTASRGRQQPGRSFAELIEQARRVSINDNSGNNSSGGNARSTTTHTATRANALPADAQADTSSRRNLNAYRQPLPAARSADAAETAAEENRRYIDDLHERVDTLRGELLVRVIQSGSAPREEAGRLTGDISRLGSRLDQLRQKLEQEQARLSGKLLDLEA